MSMVRQGLMFTAHHVPPGSAIMLVGANGNTEDITVFFVFFFKKHIPTESFQEDGHYFY